MFKMFNAIRRLRNLRAGFDRLCRGSTSVRMRSRDCQRVTREQLKIQFDPEVSGTVLASPVHCLLSLVIHTASRLRDLSSSEGP